VHVDWSLLSEIIDDGRTSVSAFVTQGIRCHDIGLTVHPLLSGIFLHIVLRAKAEGFRLGALQVIDAGGPELANNFEIRLQNHCHCRHSSSLSLLVGVLGGTMDALAFQETRDSESIKRQSCSGASFVIVCLSLGFDVMI
jgi:hypothetical protein